MSSVGAINMLRAAVQTASATSDKQSLSGPEIDMGAVLKVEARNSATTFDCKIQHSLDGENWLDLVSFTQISGAYTVPEVELKAITTPVLANLRSVTTLAGATQAATVTLDFVYGYLK